ncbi:alpha/beta fold hydrolase [Kribbella sp. NPDC051952]|uniref:alpha/beta hydrolase n=1 Tax=Kribbella sp. NPDC051952 TaxID=3154851 RepID=UPI00341C41FB
MSVVEHVVLIHGTWGRGNHFHEARAAFEARGFVVHTPTLRHHELPLEEGSAQIATLSLTDYVDDLVKVCESLDSPPLILGHSLGGLLAQLVAARTPHAGLIAVCPAPAAGIFAMYPSMSRLFLSHYLQPRPWTKPLRPTWKKFHVGGRITQTPEDSRALYEDLVCESGRAYCEMAFPQLDRRKASRVDYANISGPVLIFAGTEDLTVVPAVCRAAAAKYPNATYQEILNADHMLLFGNVLQTTMTHIDDWLVANHLNSPATTP